MKKTIELNNWEEKLFVHQLGLSHKKDTLTLHLLGPCSSFDKTFITNQQFVGISSFPSITVPVDTLDNQVQQHNIPTVDFIKIDVEGFEQQVLEGATHIIEHHTPVLFIELFEANNPTYQTTIDWLKNRNYVVLKATYDYKLVDEALHRNIDTYSMYLCLHKKKHAHWIKEIQEWIRPFRKIKLKGSLRRKVKKAIRNPIWALQRTYEKLRKQ